MHVGHAIWDYRQSIADLVFPSFEEFGTMQVAAGPDMEAN